MPTQGITASDCVYLKHFCYKFWSWLLSGVDQSFLSKYGFVCLILQTNKVWSHRHPKRGGLCIQNHPNRRGNSQNVLLSILIWELLAREKVSANIRVISKNKITLRCFFHYRCRACLREGRRYHWFELCISQTPMLFILRLITASSRCWSGLSKHVWVCISQMNKEWSRWHLKRGCLCIQNDPNGCGNFENVRLSILI